MRRAGSSRLAAGALAALGALVLAPAPAAGDEGHMVYRQVCAACHATGVAGAPRLGDRTAWAPRLDTGRASLVRSLLRGKGQMPPKGGNASLSDEDAKAALDFMLDRAR